MAVFVSRFRLVVSALMVLPIAAAGVFAAGIPAKREVPAD